MFTHYFIILHGFIVVFSSTNNRSSLIFIINSIKSRHKLSSNSIIFTTTRITNYNCHTDILSQWIRHSSSNIKVRLHLTSNKDKSYKNFHIHAKLHHFINNIYNQFSNSHQEIKKNNILTPSIYSKKLLQTSINKKNRTKYLLETNLINNRAIDQMNLISTNISRIINTSENSSKKIRSRIRRNFLQENNFNDEEDANVYGDDDRIYFRNRQEDIAEQKRGFDGEYYLPIATKFKINFPHLRSFVVRDIERNEDYLSSSWYPLICQIFQTGQIQGITSTPEKTNSFYNSINTLVSNQLRELLERSIDMWCSLFDPEDQDYLPIIKIDIILNEDESTMSKIDFQPSISEFINVLRYVVDKIAHSINGPNRIRIATIQSFLNGDDNIPLDTHLSQTVIDQAYKQLADIAEYYFQEPKQLLNTYEDKYNYLIDGKAQADVEKFNSENHTFDEYTQEFNRYNDIVKQIMLEPTTVEFPLIQTNSEQVKQGLVEAARKHRNTLVEKLVNDYRKECQSICAEYEAIKQRALAKPATTAELNDIIKYIDNAKGEKSLLLTQRIKEVQRQMEYLLEEYLFSEEDIRLNADTLLWPRNIGPVFDTNDEL
ncbi:unnamed protein product [Rotaria sp. Silwood2]|nr:unnamed protein product [Rotaria sp. Silwood2]